MDIRIDVDFLSHPKTVKLKRRLGDAGVICLLRLWCYAAKYRPKGNFNGMNDEDLEIAAQWGGDHGHFVKACEAVKYLTHDGESYNLHDWEKHNPWAYHSEERSQKARESVAKRWGKQIECGANTNRTSPSPIPFPSPIPSPTPTEAVVDFETVRKIYSDVYRDLLPSVTICEKLHWITDNFDLPTITDAFAAASSAKARTIDYVLTRLKNIKEREEERNGMAARLESGITQGVGF